MARGEAELRVREHEASEFRALRRDRMEREIFDSQFPSRLLLSTAMSDMTAQFPAFGSPPGSPNSLVGAPHSVSDSRHPTPWLGMSSLSIGPQKGKKPTSLRGAKEQRERDKKLLETQPFWSEDVIYAVTGRKGVDWNWRMRKDGEADPPEAAPQIQKGRTDSELRRSRSKSRSKSPKKKKKPSGKSPGGGEEESPSPSKKDLEEEGKSEKEDLEEEGKDKSGPLFAEDLVKKNKNKLNSSRSYEVEVIKESGEMVGGVIVKKPELDFAGADPRALAYEREQWGFEIQPQFLTRTGLLKRKVMDPKVVGELAQAVSTLPYHQNSIHCDDREDNL